MGVVPEVDLRPWFLTPEDLPPPPLERNWLFGNDRAVELEIGSGRGLFLLNAGLTQPQTNFLGIEYDFKEGRRGARRFFKRKLPNVRLLGADVRKVLPTYFPDQSVAAVHVYFPDPWWKRRHQKRRMFEPRFVYEAARILKPGGWLHAWTDVAEYFEIIQAVVAGQPAFSPAAPPAERTPAHDMDYHTSFERKKRKLGCEIFRGRWQRLEIAPLRPDSDVWGTTTGPVVAPAVSS